MKQLNKADVVIFGGGILGLAFALEATRRQKKASVFERDPRVRGTSVRNFGMIHPLGMRPGKCFKKRSELVIFGWSLAKVQSFGSILVILCWWLVPNRKL